MLAGRQRERIATGVHRVVGERGPLPRVDPGEAGAGAAAGEQEDGNAGDGEEQETAGVFHGEGGFSSSSRTISSRSTVSVSAPWKPRCTERTRPSRPTRKLVGMAGTITCRTSCWSLSRATGKGGVIRFTKAAKAASSWSTLTATMTSPCGLKSACRRAYAGNEALHGPHHEAQKSTSITWCSMAGTAPSSPAAVRSGNISPAFTSARARMAPAASASSAVMRRRKFRSTRFILVKVSRLGARPVSHDEPLRLRVGLNVVQALRHAEDEGGGRQHARLQAAVGHDRRLQAAVADRPARPRIDDMAVAT